MIQLLRKAKASELRGTALLRLDFNTEDGWRMQAALPTIRFLLRVARNVVVVSHRGRPTSIKITAGKPRGADTRLSLRNDARQLGRFLGKPVHFIPHFRFAVVRALVAAAPTKSIFLLENLRFLPGEEKNDPRLAERLANIADFYVNDAFAVSHRNDASVDAITRYLPSYAGLELEKEIRLLTPVRERPRRPLVVILGGAKAHDKLTVIRYLRNKAQAFLLGGAAANTILFLRGIEVGKSVRDKNVGDLKKIRAISRYENLVLPVDWKMSRGAILDIGKRTAANFQKEIDRAKTIIWNGPMGLIEEGAFAGGTLAVARAIAANRRAFSVAGGGETVMFLKKHRLDKKFSFISTGGGAMLDFLAGEKLPGIEALKKQR